MIDVENRVLLLSGGTISLSFARNYIDNNQFNIVIAVDSGLNIADQLNIIPDYIVGDFDSVSDIILKKYLEGKVQKGEKTPIIYEYPSQKDVTDTHIAMDLAISLHATKITILGGTGTRIDHLIGNVNLLMVPLKERIHAEIIDEHNKIYLIDSHHEICKSKIFGSYFSLLPLTEGVKGVTLKGFKYPLFNRDIDIGDSLGISNEVLDETAQIDLKQGILIAVEARD